MNKRKILLPIQSVFALFLRHFAGILLLLALEAQADSTNQTSNITGSTTGNGTNQDLTQMSLEQLMQIQVPVVESASKYEQKVTEAPASATVVTSDEIKKYGWRTLGDLLESLPGFYISYDRDYDYLGVSGVNLGDANNRVLLLINGHRINNDLNDSAPVDTSFILDVDLIDRVEIIRGPGSVLYGNNAFFAVINVITRTGKQVNGVEGSGAYGSYNAGSGRATVGGSFTNGLQFLLSGSINNNDGPGNLNFPPDGTAHNMDRDSFGSFFGSVNYSDFTLEGGYIDRYKVNPTAQYGTTFDNALLHTEDWRSYATLKFDHNLPDDWEVLGDVYYDRSDFQIGQPYFPNTVLAEQETGEWAGTELQVNKKILDKHVVSFGAEYRDDFEQKAWLYEDGSLTEVIDGHRQNYGIFGQGDFAVLDNLHFNAGVRYDQYGDFTPSWSPRAAVIYNPWEPTTFKFIYGTAFRDPDFTEESRPDFGGIRPEKISSYDLVCEQGLNRYLRSSVSGYYNRLDNLIAPSPDGGFENIQADTWGLDVSLDGKWLDEIDTRLSYSLQHTVNRATDISLPDSPLNMVKLNISAPLYKDKIFAGLEIQYTGPSKTLMFNNVSEEESPGPNAPGYAVVNFTLFSQNLVKNLDISASVYNLFNTKYYEPSSDFHFEPYIQQDGINFRIKLTYRF
jgi:iron complex outermembrane receptor protein